MKTLIIVLAALPFLAFASPEGAGMVFIPGGNYTPLYEKNADSVSVEPFHLDVSPVTNAQYLEFVRAHPEWRRSQVKPLFADANYLKHWAGDLDLGPDADKLGDAPVTNVSWFAARAYLKTLGKRLPTIDEWEYAACADETRTDATADPEFHRRILNWYGKPSAGKFPTAANFAADVRGIHALHGLVWEWVRDFNNATVTGESRGDTTLERNLFCAGGALSAGDPSNYAAFMRYALRSSLKGNYAVGNLGFRGARSVTSSPTTTTP